MLKGLWKQVVWVWVMLVALWTPVAGAAGLPTMKDAPWQVIAMPTDAILLDLAFLDAEANHGWLVGDKGTLLETEDGGLTWRLQPLAPELREAYLSSISFAGEEGWIAGEPKVLLHTTNGGQDWQRLVLSEKLPGEPMKITALGPASAEMVTNLGAIYRTEDGGKTWKALVDDAIGLLKNIARDAEGHYLGVSSRGSFYVLYEPGSRSWKPFPRESSRRIQNMGFGPGTQAWKVNQGAEIAFTEDFHSGKWSKPMKPGKTLSFGYLGAGFQNDQDLWVVGGSALLIHSPDGGKSWEQVGNLQDIPANFYAVSFPRPDRGFILGQRGTLLRYAPA
ncbi:MAG: photosynthesis system II assembly factor Ycf48 [Thermostichales cyanobacterium GMQP_bins_62]